MKQSKSPSNDPIKVLRDIASFIGINDVNRIDEMHDVDILTVPVSLSGRQLKAIKSAIADPLPVAVNTHGLTPSVQTFRLFDLGGWRMLVEVDCNDDTEGVGIRYTVTVGDGVKMSVWYGTTDDDEYEEAHTAHVATVENMTETDAAKMLSSMLGQAASFLKGSDG